MDRVEVIGSKVWRLDLATGDSNSLIRKLAKRHDFETIYAVVGIWIAYRLVRSGDLPRFVGNPPGIEDTYPVLAEGLRSYLVDECGEPRLWDSRFLDHAYDAYAKRVGRVRSLETGPALPEYVETENLDRLAVTAQRVLELLEPYRSEQGYTIPEQEVEAFCRQASVSMLQSFKEPDTEVKRRLNQYNSVDSK